MTSNDTTGEAWAWHGRWHGKAIVAIVEDALVDDLSRRRHCLTCGSCRPCQHYRINSSLQNRCEQRPCSGGFDSRPPPLPAAQTLAQFCAIELFRREKRFILPGLAMTDLSAGQVGHSGLLEPPCYDADQGLFGLGCSPSSSLARGCSPVTNQRLRWRTLSAHRGAEVAPSTSAIASRISRSGMRPTPYCATSALSRSTVRIWRLLWPPIILVSHDLPWLETASNMKAKAISLFSLNWRQYSPARSSNMRTWRIWISRKAGSSDRSRK